MTVILTEQQNCAILFEETEREFGYKVQDLSFGSTKKIIHKCPICGKPKRSLFREFLRGEKITHYKKCRQTKTIQTNIEKYRVSSTALVPGIKNKQRQTIQKKYGVKHPIQSPKIQQKMKQTMRKRYGVDFYTQSLEMQEKSRQTCLKKYGVEYSAQSSIKKAKTRQTCSERYGAEHAGRVVTYPQIKDFIEQEQHCLLSAQYDRCHSKLEIKCPKGHIYEITWANFQQGHRCPYCLHKSEHKLGQILEQICPGRIKKQGNLGFLGRQRVDYYIEQEKIAIEYDGIQHHKPIIGAFGAKTEEEAQEQLRETQERDQRKEQLCKENGWRLIRIRYDEPLTMENVRSKIVVSNAWK
jgi:very-short-patch-repair endonuclease